MSLQAYELASTDPWSNNRRTRGILLDSSC